ncbi:hypothetical protein ACA910_007110 [Epithemia clementina (nom. ined.)]
MVNQTSSEVITANGDDMDLEPINSVTDSNESVLVDFSKMWLDKASLAESPSVASTASGNSSPSAASTASRNSNPPPMAPLVPMPSLDRAQHQPLLGCNSGELNTAHSSFARVASFPPQQSGQVESIFRRGGTMVGNNVATHTTHHGAHAAKNVPPQLAAQVSLSGSSSDGLEHPAIPQAKTNDGIHEVQSLQPVSQEPFMRLRNHTPALPATQQVLPVSVVFEYGEERLAQGGNIQNKFPENQHFVCGTVKKLHSKEFETKVIEALKDRMEEIRDEYERSGKKVLKVRKYVPEVAEAAREANFKIWTALKNKEQPCATDEQAEQPGATDEQASSNHDDKIVAEVKKRRRMEVDITTQPDDSKRAPGFLTSDVDVVGKPESDHIHGFSERTFDKEWFLDITNDEASLKPRLESPLRTILRKYLNQHQAPDPQEVQPRQGAPHPVQLANMAPQVQEHRSPMDYKPIVRGFLDQLNQDSFQVPLYELYADLEKSEKNHEEWAREIYSKLRDDAQDETAKTINNYRRRLLNDWLYKLVDKWGEFGFCDEFAVVMENVLEHRVGDVLRVCLLLDRAQALYKMQPIRGMSPHGTDWFSCWHVEQPTTDGFNNLLKWTTDQRKIEFWQGVQKDWTRVYPKLKPLMNKKLYRLIFHPHLRLHKDFQLRKWAMPAESPTRPPSFCLISYPTE